MCLKEQEQRRILVGQYTINLGRNSLKVTYFNERLSDEGCTGCGLEEVKTTCRLVIQGKKISQSVNKKERKKERKIDRQKERQIKRKIDRKKDRQKERKKDRKIERKKERKKKRKE